jgi:predicted adenine nucleotide alpha hydrolase (AANH) superfamily ATPase
MREKIVIQTVKYEDLRDQLSRVVYFYNQNIHRKILRFHRMAADFAMFLSDGVYSLKYYNQDATDQSPSSSKSCIFDRVL